MHLTFRTMRPTYSPLTALLLATIFLAGNLVLPQADILFGHRPGTENETRVHLEAVGGCGNHAGHCLLSRLLSDSSGHAPAATATALFIALPLSPAPNSDPCSVPRPISTTTRSRAPPTPRL